jgi:heterodisulfide reductase subunit C
MKNFGFTIAKDRQIEYDKNDFALLKALQQLEPSVNICIGCGTCTATCTAGQFTEFNLRRMITLLKRGDASEILLNINKCMLCGKCMLACPRGVNTRNIVLKLQSLTSK